MRTYEITSIEGVCFGTYAGATERDALDALARDAGYRDANEAAEQAGAFCGSVVEVAQSAGKAHYVARGDVRGSCGHQHRTEESAEACRVRDAKACKRRGGYSDRYVVRVSK